MDPAPYIQANIVAVCRRVEESEHADSLIDLSKVVLVGSSFLPVSADACVSLFGSGTHDITVNIRRYLPKQDVMPLESLHVTLEEAKPSVMYAFKLKNISMPPGLYALEVINDRTDLCLGQWAFATRIGGDD